MDVDEVAHFATGELVARVSRANGGLIQRDMRKAARARESLRELAIEHGESDVIELSHGLFHQRSWGSMAESETFAHLEHLRHRGEVTSRTIEGRIRYRVAS